MACCRRCSVVCLLVTSVNCAKPDELIEMQCGYGLLVPQRKHVLGSYTRTNTLGVIILKHAIDFPTFDTLNFIRYE